MEQGIVTKQRIVAAAGLVLAVCGVLLATFEDPVWALLFLLVVAGFVVFRFFGTRPEAVVCGVLAFGYIVGSRGFAGIKPLGGLPLLPGEMGLALCGLFVLFRLPFTKGWDVRLSPLGLAILLWMGFCSLHMPRDYGVYGLWAVRDFAMVYYALFFFVAQGIAADARARRLFEGFLVAAFVAVPFSVILFKSDTEIVADYMTVFGMPLISHKGDLVSVYLACGAIFFMTHLSGRWRWVSLLPTVLIVGVLLSQIMRAVMVALALAGGVLVTARRYAFLVVLAGCGLLGVMLEIGYHSALGRSLYETRAYMMYERVLSIADVDGGGEYRVAQAKPDNNRFRLVWWRVVGELTWSQAPLMGLGFGFDLGDPFVAEYYMRERYDFYARSPHNFLVTLFGRTGLIGLVFFGAVLGLAASAAWRTVREAARGGGRDALAYWVMALVVFVAGVFGVVLEGPMGAFLFWTFLGMAEGRQSDRSAA